MSQFGATARSAAPAAIVAVTLAVAVPAVPVAAAAPLRGPCVQVPVGSVQRFLGGVSASSAANAWAVGFASSAAASRDVTLRWNGSKWSCVPSPSPPDSDLTAVATTSPRNAWAVGYRDAKGGPLSPAAKTLIERWNGRRWEIVSSPAVGPDATLDDVAAVSRTDAWAVGSVGNNNSAASRTLVERWNGRAWARVPSPSPRTGGLLQSVTVISASDVWAVGSSSFEQASITGLIEHWNGSTWTTYTALDDPSLSNVTLHTVAASSASDIWAGGVEFLPGPHSLVVFQHWNGTSWTQIHGASPTAGSIQGAADFSKTDAWAIDDGPNEIERWKGSAWSLSPGVRLPVGTTYWDIGGHSGSDIWLVGETDRDGEFLIEHWNGKAWKRDNKLPLLSA